MIIQYQSALRRIGFAVYAVVYTVFVVWYVLPWIFLSMAVFCLDLFEVQNYLKKQYDMV